MLENGNYRARAIQGVLSETKGGKEQVAVEFELLDEGFVGQKITWYGYFTEKTWERTIKSLRACGWYGDDISQLDGLSANEVSLVVEREEYEGKVRAKVQWVNSLDGGIAVAPMAPERAKRFAQTMRGQILAMEKAEGRAPAQKAPPRPAPKPSKGTDPNADIPF
jgi:hypothetical protein